MIKTTIGITCVVVALYNPVAVANQISVFDECKRYRVEEEYVRGGINDNGNYKKGYIKTRKNRVSCNPYGEVSHNYQPTHSYHPHHYPYPHHSPYPYPQHAPHPQTQPNTPVVVNNAPVAPIPQNQCGKVGRMGIGGVLGGLTGYYAGGGKKSSRTIMNTVIGSGIGMVMGRITC